MQQLWQRADRKLRLKACDDGLLMNDHCATLRAKRLEGLILREHLTGSFKPVAPYLASIFRQQNKHADYCFGKTALTDRRKGCDHFR